MKSRFAHSIKGRCPLWRAREVLIPFLCVNNSWTILFKIRRPLLVFLTFSLNKRWWRLPLVFSVGDECALLIYFPSSSRRKAGCDKWQLHWGDVRELSHLVSVQFFSWLFLYLCSLLSFILMLCSCSWSFHSATILCGFCFNLISFFLCFIHTCI